MKPNPNQELIDDGYLTMTILRMGKLNRFRFLWKNGREFGYPICCIFRFSFEDALRDGKSYDLTKNEFKGNGVQRGSVFLSNGETYVPCGVFHWSEFAAKTPPIMKLLRKDFMFINVSKSALAGAAVAAGVMLVLQPKLRWYSTKDVSKS